MKQTFATASELLDDMIKINRSRYTRDNLISSTHKGPSKEKLTKDQERDKHIAKC